MEREKEKWFSLLWHNKTSQLISRSLKIMYAGTCKITQMLRKAKNKYTDVWKDTATEGHSISCWKVSLHPSVSEMLGATLLVLGYFIQWVRPGPMFSLGTSQDPFCCIYDKSCTAYDSFFSTWMLTMDCATKCASIMKKLKLKDYFFNTYALEIMRI